MWAASRSQDTLVIFISFIPILILIYMCLNDSTGLKLITLTQLHNTFPHKNVLFFMSWTSLLTTSYKGPNLSCQGCHVCIITQCSNIMKAPVCKCVTASTRLSLRISGCSSQCPCGKSGIIKQLGSLHLGRGERWINYYERSQFSAGTRYSTICMSSDCRLKSFTFRNFRNKHAFLPTSHSISHLFSFRKFGLIVGHVSQRRHCNPKTHFPDTLDSLQTTERWTNLQQYPPDWWNPGGPTVTLNLEQRG